MAWIYFTNTVSFGGKLSKTMEVESIFIDVVFDCPFTVSNKKLKTTKKTMLSLYINAKISIVLQN
jgi:hypothetical protein